MSPASRMSWFQALVLWFCTFAGGAVFGSGVFLDIQVQVTRSLRQQVDDLNFLERGIGKATFLWRDPDQQLILTLHEIPEEYLTHSERVARGLMGLGFVGVALLLPRFLRRRFRR